MYKLHVYNLGPKPQAVFFVGSNWNYIMELSNIYYWTI